MVELHEVLMNCLLILREVVLVFVEEAKEMEMKRRVKKRGNENGFLIIEASIFL